MPQSCSVRGCKSALIKNSGISFHCFPKEEKMRQIWLSSMCFGVLKWDRRPRVCSRHFKKEDFVFGGNVKLSKFAIPSVQSVNDVLPSSSLENIPSISSSKLENPSIAPEAGPANCSSTSHKSHSTIINDVLTAATPNIPCYKVKAAINTKPEVKPSTSKLLKKKVLMTQANDIKNADTSFEENRMLTTNIVTAPQKVTRKRKLEPFSEASNNSFETRLVNMSWISEQPYQAKGVQITSTTSTTKKGKTQTEKFETTSRALEENNHMDVRSCNKERCRNLRSITILENEVAYLKQENERLQKLSIPKPQFYLQKFSANDKKILYYTGFQTYQILSIVFKWVLPSGDINDIIIYDVSQKKKKTHRLRKLSAENQFFLTLIRLRRGMPIETLSDLFSISKACANSIFLAWVNLLYLRLGSLDIWPNRNELIKRASDSMRENYPNVLGSIDCTEFFIQRPSSLVKQSQCYSNYKGATTLKSLIMIDPAGAIIYTSPLFAGSISDKAIIEDSGFIDILKEKVNEGQILPGDTILADKWFNVRDLFEAINLYINIPVFRVGGIQFTSEEVSVIREVAHERIHVERAIGRLKNYKILSQKITISSLGAIEQIYTVCVLLSNFRHSLIKKKNT